MDTKFAGSNENQSGQRFLDSSAPRLIRHVASCETAAGGEISQTAGKEQKLSREFEGGALISAEGAVPSALILRTSNLHVGHSIPCTGKDPSERISNRYSAEVEANKL
jgi:hypothetical protein